MTSLPEILDDLYEKLHRRCFVHPDPLECLYAYDDARDREIAGLIVAGLAYGRVSQILTSCHAVLNALGPAPGEYVRTATPGSLREVFANFRHRWTTGLEIAELVMGIQSALARHGSLETCFRAHLHVADGSPAAALQGFRNELLDGVATANSLLPEPGKGSACKRLHLYLRWMVRQDAVDPGGWTVLSPADLVVPLDTHMHRIARALGFTNRRQGDGRTAREVTRAFSQIRPDDPTRYDFALTRLGIRSDMTMDTLFSAARVAAC